MRSLGVLLACLLLAPLDASAGPNVRTVAEARTRVDHHLQHVEAAVARLDAVLREPCPGFATPAEWGAYQEAREQDVILLLAHLEQAWVEAKAGGDDQVRREAKAPRRRAEEGLRLVDKLQACAGENHASFDPLTTWLRIEREVPRRQREIALPE